MNKVLTVDMSPIEDFKYNQISNYKFEFVLLNSDLRAVHSPFECKDYLQDIFWCEHNKKNSSIYGLHWKHGMFDVNQDFFYLALSGGALTLKDRIEPLQKFLNAFEDALSIPRTKVHPTENDKIIVLKFSKDWTINGQMLSAYTTLIRVSGAYQDGNPIDYLVQVKKRTISLPKYSEIEAKRIRGGEDSYSSGGKNLEKLYALYLGERPTNTWEEMVSIGEAHNQGITETANFPKINLPAEA